MSSWLQSLQMHEILIYGLVFGLPVVVIGFAFLESTVKALIKHRERMIMHEEGLDLDYFPEEPEVANRPAPRHGNMNETQPYVARRG